MVFNPTYCVGESSRYPLQHPLLLPDGRCLVTDSRIMLLFDNHEDVDGVKREVKDSGKFEFVETETGISKLPKWQDVMNQWVEWEATEWHPVPDFDASPCHIEEYGDDWSVACSECGGSGMEICPRCEHEGECIKCDGSGTEWCDCAHSAFNLSPLSVEVTRRYFRELQRLPNCLFSQPRDDWKKPVILKFDGGKGLLMGLEQDRRR